MRKGSYVYQFSEGSKELKNLLGGKGANLAEMARIGLPVPPGFIITTEACNRFLEGPGELWSDLQDEIMTNLSILENESGRSLGGERPLLLSVRSGAVISMPGMMDTVLNLGLNGDTVEALARETGDRRFALDCYRRFLQMFGEVVLQVDHFKLDNVMTAARREARVAVDSALGEEDLKAVVRSLESIIAEESAVTFPHDPREQLFLAVEAVFRSWNTARARVYRRANGIPDDLGTAVNIQAMVFGNLGEDSGTGVAFTRDPSTGENVLYGEYLLNAQGEDVVAGTRTPHPIRELAGQLPEAYSQFKAVCRMLEEHYRDLQDIEFTIEKGRLYILQTRSGKRTAQAAVRVAVEMAAEGLLSREEAVLSVEPALLEQLLHHRLDPGAVLEVIARGLPASPGAASGRVVFDADRAQELAQEGENVLLVRPETTPDDIHGIIAARGVLTSRGGMTSHAAVVARGMGKPCICGCEALEIDLADKRFFVEKKEYSEGTVLTIDGSSGQVILGEAPLIEPRLSEEFKLLLGWADEFRRMKVRANADNPDDAARAVQLGAEGIGLCRTEHMFMAPERVPVVQDMILAEDGEKRQEALERLLPMQREDFMGIFRAMAGRPVTVRLLDPPLHEFLPHSEELALEIAELRRADGASAELRRKELILQKVRSLEEFNPMLGHRGCRLGLVYPEIYRMQVTALFQALFSLMDEGMDQAQLQPEVMIPLVGHPLEMSLMKDLVHNTAKELFQREKRETAYLVGTMIELPRACLVAEELARHASFFSFGTNDLTQTTLGYSRDDAEGKFLPFYIGQGILKANPFVELDVAGVGALVQRAVREGRRARSGLKIGICGEHGGDPSSIRFFEETGLDYISCSPYRLPVARLAAAQATLVFDGQAAPPGEG